MEFLDTEWDKGYGLEATKHNLGLFKKFNTTEITEYSVAPEGAENPEDYDFEDFETAMKFAQDAIYSSNGAVVLNLANGTHYIKTNPTQPSIAQTGIGAYNIGYGTVYIFGEDASNTYLTFDPSLNINGGYVFRLLHAKLYITNITIDFELGQPTVTTAPVLFRYDHSIIDIYNSVVRGFSANKVTLNWLFSRTGYVSIVSSVIENFSAVVAFSQNSYWQVKYSTLRNLDDVVSKPNKYLPVTTNAKFEGNTYDAVANINSEIPYIFEGGGGIGTDSTRPPNMNSWSGATAERPDMTFLNGKAWGGNYFDTDINKPIWWNGTMWVDSTGTAV